MRLANRFAGLGLLLALMLAVAGCPGGGSNPPDGGDDGDGGQVECTTAAQCDDGNVCTDDACTDGECVYTNNSVSCNDGQECSTNDVCSNGVCSGTALGCDDGNPCTNDSCNETGCIHPANTAPCDDGDACTLGDVCADGTCGGSPIDCDDDNVCTDDTCNPASGCVYTPNNAACDDGQACSSNDHCSNGVCVGDSDVECDDDNPCTEDRCDDSLGCVHSYNVAPCDDGNACTGPDACSQGVCGGLRVDCDDNNACTTDSCDPAAGCLNENNTDPCDDGDSCTVGDLCADGACTSGGARDCNDNNICTDDSCVQGLGCAHANNTVACDDGDACTSGDMCLNGTCQGGGSPFDCDDSNPCTDDDCDPVNGCSHSYNTDACDDADACTIDDVCSNGVCSGAAKDTDGDTYIDEACGGQDCDDSDAAVNPGVFEGPVGDAKCADNVDNNCNGLTDLQEVSCGSCNDNGDCDDNNVCNGAETCSGGNCVAGTALDCNDNELCTTDNCDPASGCAHVNNTLPCSDGDACTTGDVCSGGSCQAGGGALSCDDSDPCTDDSCSPASGCQHGFNTAPCDDGDDCTTGDTCSNGTCMPGAGGPDCDDANPCTDDTCVDGVGCVHSPLDGDSCDDGNLCTQNDQCSNGTCTGSSVNCDDGNVCTTDSCNPASGCVHNPVSGNCNDGDACTESDHCSAGACVGTIRDQDGDGYGDGETCAGDDCDDGNPNINPGVPEACGDGLDNNCNDVIDEGCSGCNSVVAAGLLQIDNDAPLTSYGLTAGDEAVNAFFVEAPSYNAIEVDVYFYDFSGGTGTAQGNYSLHVYADDAGLPGTELATVGSTLITEAWDVPHTFTLPAPVGFTQGELFWVGVRSEQDQSTNAFLPLIDGGIGVPYQGGALYSLADDGYYGVMGNWFIRVQGCGEGPWLELGDHAESLPALPAGGSVSSTAILRNRGFADASSVTGMMSVAEPEIVLTTDTSNFGNINQGSTATGSPAYGISADVMAHGIYGMQIEASDGPNAWTDAYGVYVQGSACAVENTTLQTDDGVDGGFVPATAAAQYGNYFVASTTSFSLTSVAADMVREAGAGTTRYRVKVYTYRSGYPDKLIFTGGWVNVTQTDQFTQAFPVSPALTFKQGDTFFVVLESQNTSSATEGQRYGLSADDGDFDASWYNGYVWDPGQSAWAVTYFSFFVRPNGCAATELVYDSHTSNPDPIQKGQSATLNITIRNIGAEDATNVSGTLISSSPDITVTQATRSYGTVAAGATDTANGFQINVAAGAAGFQYPLDLALTDGVNTWNAVVPIQLAGGTRNLTVQNFAVTLVGNDIQYHWEVANTGNVDVTNSFSVDLYVDRGSAPGVGDAGDWADTPASLGVGESIPYDLYWQDAPTGAYDAWVQVDTNNDIAESNEGDNVDGPETVTVGAADVFELLSPPRKWFPADVPVDYRFVTGNSQSGLSQASARDAVRVGFAQWAGSGANISFNEIADAPASQDGYIEDGYSTMTFNDPNGEVPSGALAATLPIYNGQTMVTNGVTFYRMTDSDIVVNNNISFVRNGDPCSNDFDLDGVLTHEQGHLVGLDHTDVYNATMYYAIGPCEMDSVSLEQSDINGVTFIYP